MRFFYSFVVGVCYLAGTGHFVHAAAAPSPLEIVLVSEGGNTPLDRRITVAQAKIKAASKVRQAPLLEQLGWLFVAKARLSNDPGYYKLAEQCALGIEVDAPQATGALLLRGHILDVLHRFRDAEKVARELVQLWPDGWEAQALLGDALMEQGQLPAAIEAYQTMVNLKPCAQTYQRIAHVRWLTGDLDGALEMLRLSVEAGSTRDPEPAAWAYTRLALYQFQATDTKSAAQSLSRACQFVPDYAPALLLRGKMLLADQKPVEAIAALKVAATENPLPDYQWTLADAQRAAGLTSDAEQTEKRLIQTGGANDPRTLALFLATRNEQPETALNLARTELETRHDVFTLDALAWSQLAAGKVAEARTNSRAALAEGTQDARLFFHAATIAMAAGEPAEAEPLFQKASALQQMLLPSERDRLAALRNAKTLTLNHPTTQSQSK